MLFRTYGSPSPSSDLLKGEYSAPLVLGLQYLSWWGVLGVHFWEELCFCQCDRLWRLCANQLSYMSSDHYASALMKHSSWFCLLPANPKDNFMLTILTGLMETSIFILCTGGCQREMACIVYKALLHLCINKYLQGSDKEKSAVSAPQQKYWWLQLALCNTFTVQYD